jgi:hypothetical protein
MVLEAPEVEEPAPPLVAEGIRLDLARLVRAIQLVRLNNNGPAGACLARYQLKRCHRCQSLQTNSS